MSRLDELIAELCPDGVESVTLEDLKTSAILTVLIPSFKIKKNNYKESGKTPIVSQEVELISGYCDVSDDKISLNNYVCFGDHSEHIKYVDFPFVQGADGLKIMYVDESVISTRYLYHSLLNNYVKHNTYERHFKYLLETSIPLPPPEVQREIVRILDAYSEKVAELTDRLAAELDARKKQYEYYSCQIVESASDVKMVKVRDLGKWSGGGTPSKDVPEFWEGGTIPWITSKDMKSATVYDSQLHITELATQNSTAKLLPKNVVAVVVRSGILKHTFPVAYIPIQTTVNQDLKTVVAKEGIMPRYIYFVLSAYADDILAKTKKQGGTVDSLEVPKFLDYEVPLPPLAEQERIVSILDRFDKLCSDITSGLPAEIEARRKQYEHYRDQLLTFKEKTA